ncbi:hypothetical protein DCAR_0519974 [Daucus carota subsp. sativus]|uniref:Uncharacterized protein n=1 Tax=Daucus carota subsp. sativus TaxID=79200 RepID=A0A175YCC6_DAUCS|nr:hypothetical protein DCAR_0519974 [Daucus carota subsp. sativus]
MVNMMMVLAASIVVFSLSIVLFPIFITYHFEKEQALAGYEIEYINLQGRIVVPGFFDSHVHFLYGGLQIEHAQQLAPGCCSEIWSAPYCCFIAGF